MLFPGLGMRTSPARWHCSQILSRAAPRSFAGLRIDPGTGLFAWASPGPWQRSPEPVVAFPKGRPGTPASLAAKNPDADPLRNPERHPRAGDSCNKRAGIERDDRQSGPDSRRRARQTRSRRRLAARRFHRRAETAAARQMDSNEWRIWSWRERAQKIPPAGASPRSENGPLPTADSPAPLLDGSPHSADLRRLLARQEARSSRLPLVLSPLTS